MDEIWKDIKGYEGYYQVSSLGNIKSKERIVSHNNETGAKRHVKERIMKPAVNRKGGYVTIVLSKNRKQLSHRVNRLVAKAFLDNPKNFPEVHHMDHNKLNNKLDNLKWVSHSDNLKECFDKGFHSGVRPVGCYSNGILVKKYSSVSEAAKDYSNVQRALRKIIKPKSGYDWVYL